jgi:hypothetical protein
MKTPTIEIGTTEKAPRNIRTEPPFHTMLHMAAIREGKDMGDLFAEMVLSYLQVKHPDLLPGLAKMLGQGITKGK